MRIVTGILVSTVAATALINCRGELAIGLEPGVSGSSNLVEPPPDSGAPGPGLDSGEPSSPDGGQPEPGGTPFVVAHVANPAFIAVDDANVYWATYDTGPVGSVPKGGGASTQLDESSATTIAIDASRVYTVSASGLVVACAKTGCGGNPTTLASGQTGVWGVAVDDANVYWTLQGATGGVMKAPLGGGAPVALATGTGATSIAVAGGTVFYAGQADLRSVPANGGSSTVLYTPPDGISALTLDATNVYFGTTGGTVGRVPLAGGAPTTLATGQGSVGSVAVDAANVYWVAFPGDPTSGSVAFVPIAGGSPTVIASGQFAPDGIAVDATSVYWSVGGPQAGDGAIMKLPK